jgi:RNA polymerase sigma-70 factor (ECF subfamily)
MGNHERRESDILTLITNKRYIRGELEKRRELLYRLAFSWCHNPALADDLVQDAMVKALKNARQLKDAAAIKGWLSKILANCWYDHLRRTRETVDLDNLPYEETASSGDEHEQQDIVSRVRAKIAELPIGQRQVITLVDLAGFSYAEISHILDIPVGTVMSRISRARKALRAKLADYDPRHDILRAKIRRIK